MWLLSALLLSCSSRLPLLKHQQLPALNQLASHCALSSRPSPSTAILRVARNGSRCSCLIWQTLRTTLPTKSKFNSSLSALSLWRSSTTRVRIGNSQCLRLSVATCHKPAPSLSSPLVSKSVCARRTIATTGGHSSSPKPSVRKTLMTRTLKPMQKTLKKLPQHSSD